MLRIVRTITKCWWMTGGTETSWKDNNVNSGTKYLYRVQALGNDGKEGSMSLPAQVVIP